MDMGNVHVTTGLLWRSTVLFLIIAAIVVASAVRFVSPARFRLLRTYAVASTFAVWFCIWSAMSLLFWDSVYAHVFPAWARWFLPFPMGIGFAAAGLLVWHLARRAGDRCVFVFVFLGGLLGPLTHAWAVFRGIVAKPPPLLAASPLAAIAVSWPEFTIYFAVIISLAASAQHIVHRTHGEKGRQA